MIEESLCPVARTRCVSWLVTLTVLDDLSGRGDMEEEEENVKFLQVLTRFYFLCAATQSIDPYKLALHSFPTFQVFRHSRSFTRVQPGPPGHTGHLSH